jgi:hypothetical protein
MPIEDAAARCDEWFEGIEELFWDTKSASFIRVVAS